MSATKPSTTRSSELYQRARKVLPGGVNSPVRAMRAIGRDPIFIASGEGATITDVDGNEYVDWVSSWGPLILGHAHPDVLKAIADAAARGTSFGAPTEGEVALAAEVVDRIPSVEMLRMTSSGTEATMSALRLARAVTGRDRILKFAGAYHGHVDGLLAQAGSGLATQGIPASPGVTASAAAATVIAPWNDPQALIAATGRHELAAIIVEPVPANMGVVPAAAGFLELLREQADQTGALLIFDEVITGFRVARGGAQERYGVLPDLTIMGKVIGGGLPAAAYGGSRRLMERIAPAGDVYQAGTLSGNPLAVAAALATLEQLDADAYARLADTTSALSTGSRAGRARCRLPRQRPDRARTLDRVLQRGAGAFLLRRRRVRPRRLRRVVPGAARPRRVPAGLPVRGLVPVARALRRRPRPDHQRGAARRSRKCCGGEDGPGRSPRAARGARCRGRNRRRPARRPPAPEPDAPLDEPGPAQIAATGPRAPGREHEYELLLEMILEGYRLHYGQPLVVTTGDEDLALLLGDQLYALGLSRLAALGDLDAVAELADVISLPPRRTARPTASSPRRSGRPARCRSAGVRARPTAGPRSARGLTSAAPISFSARPPRPFATAPLETSPPPGNSLLVTFVARLLGVRVPASVGVTFSWRWRYAVGV